MYPPVKSTKQSFISIIFITIALYICVLSNRLFSLHKVQNVSSFMSLYEQCLENNKQNNDIMMRSCPSACGAEFTGCSAPCCVIKINAFKCIYINPQLSYFLAVFNATVSTRTLHPPHSHSLTRRRQAHC